MILSEGIGVLKKILAVFLTLVIIVIAGVWIWAPTVNGPLVDFLSGKQLGAPADNVLKDRFKLPDGFKIGVFADEVPNARMMAMTSAGDIVVSSNRTGSIFLLYADRNYDGVSDGRQLLLSALDGPHGVALKDGYLYIAEQTRIIRGRYDPVSRNLSATETIFDGMPSTGGHSTRTIDFGPDGKLYVTVGSSCNVCVEEEPYRAEMLVMNADGSGARTYATGLRNSVGFDWQPETGQLYATDNGRDLLGDDTPNCELNLIADGADYGWPYAYDDKVADPDYGDGNEDKVANSIAPVHGFGAHRAPLGITFLDPAQAPDGYENVALAALHGSWNSSKLVGYKVVSLHFDGAGNVEERDFLTGFELDEDVIGRPVGFVHGPDGSIYISDDYAGVVYRVGYGDIPVGYAGNVTNEYVDPLAELEPADLATQRAAGALIFAVNGCASCHVAAAAPEGVQVKELKNLKQRYTIDSMISLIANPPGVMPKLELSDAERRALSIYVLANEDEIAKGPPKLGIDGI